MVDSASYARPITYKKTPDGNPGFFVSEGITYGGAADISYLPELILDRVAVKYFSE